MRLGERQFTDDTTRPAYRSDDSRQFVLDDAGESVYGTCFALMLLAIVAAALPCGR